MLSSGSSPPDGAAVTRDYSFPFHRSTSDSSAPPAASLPTAMQKVSFAQETPERDPLALADRSGAAVMDQAVPFQISAKFCSKAPRYWTPTAAQKSGPVHDTLLK